MSSAVANSQGVGQKDAPGGAQTTPPARVDLSVEAWWLVQQLYRWDDWVHRRVETLEFVSFQTLRRHTSVDLTVPGLEAQLANAMRGRRGGLVIPSRSWGSTQASSRTSTPVTHAVIAFRS